MYEEFQDVGLMTGDVTINPTASCLVMTTEVKWKHCQICHTSLPGGGGVCENKFQK